MKRSSDDFISRFPASHLSPVELAKHVAEQRTLGDRIIQGDVRFTEVLERLGATVSIGENLIEVKGNVKLRAIDMDMNHIPDAAMTAAVLALFADGPSTLRNIGSWRVKET
ncbi:MAG: hypothetical protein KY432_12385, partial [Acidobacteria bacterium]|nr:hypothetical protein [Acidobacteriota bacterium]